MADTALSINPQFYKPKPMRVRLKKWTRAEYDNMVAAGILTERNKVELIEGEIVQKMSQNPPHIASIKRTTRVLARFISDTVDLAVQLPLAIGDISEPEPDLALVPVSNNSTKHSETAFLVIEIADSSLVFDRTRKLLMYAKAGISDYWIVNINERVVEVYRDPIKVNGRGRYQTQLRFAEGETLTPLNFENAQITVNDLLP